MDEAIMGIIGGMFLGAVTMGLIGYFLFLEYRKKKLLSDQVMLLIEKGGGAPDIDSLIPKPNYYRRGLIAVFFGLALGIGLWVNAGIQQSVWGLLFIGLGAAYLIVEQREKK